MNLLLKKVCLFGLYFFCSWSYAGTLTTPVICDQEYALCTSAPCIPLPGSKTDAVCDCAVKKGHSAGYKSCEQRKPHKDKYKTLSLISTFSFAQFGIKKSMNCPKGSPWTNCVDMPCTVDPADSKRALCKCKINATQAFLTFGGSCDTRSCTTHFWSGTTLENGIVLRKALIEKNKQQIRSQPMWCSVNKES